MCCCLAFLMQLQISVLAQVVQKQAIACYATPSQNGVVGQTVGQSYFTGANEMQSVVFQGFQQPQGQSSMEQELPSVDILASLYPIPASTHLNLRFKETMKEGRVELLDGLGRTIINPVMISNSDIYKLELDNIPPGIYFIKVTEIENAKQQVSTLVITK